MKQKGNAAFASHDWLTAVDFYTQAIEKNDKDPSFYCNRAQVRICESSRIVGWRANAARLQANIKLESYGYAVADAAKAIELDSNYVKVGLVIRLVIKCSLIGDRLTTGERVPTLRF